MPKHLGKIIPAALIGLTGLVEAANHSYVNSKTLVLYYMNTNKGSLPTDIQTKAQSHLQKLREFNWRNSFMSYNMEYLPPAVISTQRNVSGQYGIPGDTVTKDLKALGYKPGDFNSVIVVNGFGGHWAGGGAIMDGTAHMLDVGWYPGSNGDYKDFAGVMVHEYNHAIDAKFRDIGQGFYPSDHPGSARAMGEFVGNYGPDNFDISSKILRFWGRDRMLSMAGSVFGALKSTTDTDGDGLPDGAGLPVTEATMGTSTTKADTDNDGLSDLTEAMANNLEGSNGTSTDSDADGILDAADLSPVYAVNNTIPRASLSVQNDLSTWPLAGTLNNGADKVYLASDDQFLYVGILRQVDEGKIALFLDNNRDGYFTGSDNLKLEVESGTLSVTHQNAAAVPSSSGDDHINTTLPSSQFPWRTSTSSQGHSYQFAIPKSKLYQLDLGDLEKIGLSVFFQNATTLLFANGDLFPAQIAGGQNTVTLSGAPTQSIVPGQTVNLSAQIQNPSGTITGVEFYANGMFIGEDLTAPYTQAWTPEISGNFAITAKVKGQRLSTAAYVDVLELRQATSNSTTPGLNYKYYSGAWSELPDFATLTPTQQGNTAQVQLSERSGDYNFGTTFEGYFQAPADGIYEFSLNSDDGSRLWIGSSLLVDNNGNHPMQERSAKIGLKAGLHPLRIAYYQGGGGFGLEAYVSGPGLNKAQIAASQLFRSSATCTEAAWNTATAYSGGAKVSYNGKVYQAKWWTQGNQPDLFVGEGKPWAELSTCSSGSTELQAPIVDLTAPAANSTASVGSPITLSAQASDADGSVSKVEFFVNEIKVGEDNTAPYQINWTANQAGSYSVRARATDLTGLNAQSTEKNITVNAVIKPEIQISSPSESQVVYQYPSDAAGIQVLSNVDGKGALVDSVQYTVVETLCDGPGCVQVRRIGVKQAPFTLNYQPNFNTNGFTQVQAFAFAQGQVSDAASRSFTVKALPEVSLVAPAKNAVLASSSFTLDLSLNTHQTAIDSVLIFSTDLSGFGIGTSIVERKTKILGSNPDLAYVATPGARQSSFNVIAFGPNGTYSRTLSTTVQYNQAPDVLITQPNSSNKFNVGGSVTVSANVSDINSNLQQVEIYSPHIPGSNVILTQAPWTATFSNLPSSGQRYSTTFVVKATDALGAVNGASVDVAENRTPTVSLSAPANNASYTAPAAVTLTASAADQDGSVSKVEFYQGTTLLGTSTASPYTYVWSGVSAGTYSLIAKVFDDLGATANSSAVNISVTGGSCTTPAWNASTAYSSNNQVSRNGKVYRANWWNQNKDPLQFSNPYQEWTLVGNCSARRALGVLENSWQNVEIIDASGRIVWKGQEMTASQRAEFAKTLQAGNYLFRGIENQGLIQESFIVE